MWERLVGQEHAVAVLRSAAAHPVHAYLLAGPPGAGLDVASRAFAVALIGAEGDARVEDLVSRGLHPDVVEFEPEGTFFLKDQATAVVDEAARSPVEGARKVIVVRDAHRMNDESGNKLLKTIEEPPEPVVFVLTTSILDEVLPTIRSRCQRVDLRAVPVGMLVAALTRGGADEVSARRAATLAGGDLERARLLLGARARLRRAFAEVPAQVDGTGATAARLAAGLDATITDASQAAEQRQADELAQFEAEMERHGYEGRPAERLRRRIVGRHKREAARLRRDLLLEGVAALESVYRDALVAPAPALNDDVPVPSLSARACADALDACREARTALVVNEKGLVRLTYLLLTLPPAAVGSAASRAS